MNNALTATRNRFMALVQKMASQPNASADWTELDRRISKGNVILTPFVIEDTRIVTAQTSMDFFDEGDVKENGLRNIAQARLPKGQYFMPSYVIVKGAFDGATAFTDAIMKATSFDNLADLNKGLENGALTVRVEDSPVLRELILSGCDTEGRDDLPKGALAVPGAELIKEQEHFSAKIDFAGTAPTNAAIKIQLVGIISQTSK